MSKIMRRNTYENTSYEFNNSREVNYKKKILERSIGNIYPGVEFNFYMDPEAAFIVFKEAERVNKIINLVTWETVFKRTNISTEWRKNVLGMISTPMIDLINKAESKHLIYEKWSSADCILSSVVIDSKLIKSEVYDHLDVETCGNHARGSIFLNHDFIKNLTSNCKGFEEEMDIVCIKQKRKYKR
ncbi:conserved hypothetical protein [Pediculus humanus corporis]|uniref:Inosine/uridine-preferring nucleoside hydrolase domain-containing protein n=1 Tax=Pediculus humanus subsp. corporis TaxID=121224 RepID=E0VHP1_PEDHC|nr:uncharacterized protein Phum_PHUM213940 [Pediculus humanus corporis]EEB12927.1 conserved hypothetical protein [Pediculus humanus corporis]